MSRWRLDGFKIVVTGGSKGLGRATVEECLALGASVLFTARGREELDRVQASLAAVHGAGRVHTMAADVSTADGRAALVARVAELWGGTLDVLVNNVGTNDRRPAADVTAEGFESMIATNQTSAFFMCTLCLPLLRKSSQKLKPSTVIF